MKKTTVALALSVAVILGWTCNQDADVATHPSTETTPMHFVGYMSEEEHKQFVLEGEKLLSRIHGKPMRLEDMRKLEDTRK